MEHVVHMNLIEFLSKSQPYPGGLDRGGGGLGPVLKNLWFQHQIMQVYGNQYPE